MLNVQNDEDLILLDEFIVSTYERNRNNEIRGNDQCMQGHSKVSQYWDAKNKRTMNKNFHQTEAELDNAPLEQTIHNKAIIPAPEFWTMILCLCGFFILTYPPLAGKQ